MDKEIVLEGRRVIIYPPKNKNSKNPPLLILNGDSFLEDYFNKNKILRRRDILTCLVVSPDRSSDYTPWPLKAPFKNSEDFKGGADTYILFLKDKLLPFLRDNFSADINNAAILGQSLGALFNLYLAVKEPELFNTFLCISPSSWYEGLTLFFEENASCIKAENWYISCGKKEGSRCRDIRKDTVPLAEKIIDILKTEGYKVTEYWDRGDHISFIYERYFKALNEADEFLTLRPQKDESPI